MTHALQERNNVSDVGATALQDALKRTISVVTGSTCLGLGVHVSVDGRTSPNLCLHWAPRPLKVKEWGTVCRQAYVNVRHNSPSLGGSGEEGTRFKPVLWPSVTTPEFNHHQHSQAHHVPPPLRKPAGTSTSRGRPKFRIR